MKVFGLIALIGLAGCAGQSAMQKQLDAANAKIADLKERATDSADEKSVCESALNKLHAAETYVKEGAINAAHKAEDMAVSGYESAKPVVSEKLNSAEEWAKKEWDNRIK
jgi:hypothetical protein